MEFIPPAIPGGNFQVEYAIRIDSSDMPDTKKLQDIDNGIQATKSYFEVGIIPSLLSLTSLRATSSTHNIQVS